MIIADNIEPEFIGVEEQQFLEGLIIDCAINEDEKSNLNNELAHGITRERADELRNYLYLSLPNPVTHGSRYSLTQITTHLKKICRL